MRKLRSAWSAAWPLVAFGIAFIALWEAFVEWRDVPPFVLPKPSVIWEQLTENHDIIMRQGGEGLARRLEAPLLVAG